MKRAASPLTVALDAIERGAALDAWAFVATAADPAVCDGPLAGTPFGVKDIIDVAGMPTAFGLSGQAREARFDAWCVAALRAAGAVPVGKTRTTPHAYRDPAPTRNPLDPLRTPGGSSAGSAAAVAAGHVPFALGTQTIGSVLRPAAYCGVVGFKPTWGRIPMNGVAPFAPSLDHVGVIARDVASVDAVVRVLIAALPDGAAHPVRLGVALRDAADRSGETASAPTMAALTQLRAAGLVLEDIALPAAIGEAPADADLLCAYEAHAVLAPLLDSALPPELRQLLQRGAHIDRSRYEATLEARLAACAGVDALLRAYDAVIVPSGGPAPGRETTGDGRPYAAWSYFGVPAIGIPLPRMAPAAVGLQLVAARGRDGLLLRAAVAVETALQSLAGSVSNT